MWGVVLRHRSAKDPLAARWCVPLSLSKRRNLERVDSLMNLVGELTIAGCNAARMRVGGDVRCARHTPGAFTPCSAGVMMWWMLRSPAYPVQSV